MGPGGVISTRHIRKDWPEWVDWQNQKTVSSMCGVRTKPHLAGIPGITNQPQVVIRAGRKAWGWCGACVKRTWPYYLPPALTPEITSSVIRDLHRAAQGQLVRQYEAILIQKRNRLAAQGHIGDANAVQDDIDDLNDEFWYVFNKVTDTPAS